MGVNVVVSTDCLRAQPLPESASVDVDDEYDGVADVEERQASFWRMLCVQDNKGKYAHQLAAQVCGPDSMITKKVNWAVSRVPKDVRPYGMMRGDRQRHAGLEVCVSLLCCCFFFRC